MTRTLDPWAENEVWKTLQKSGKKGQLYICDQPFEIGAPTVTFKEKPAWSFEAARSSATNKQKSNLFSKRRNKGGGQCTTIEQVRQQTRLLVVHSDVTRSSADCFRVLVGRGFSTHLMLDFDGTLYQGLDLRDCAWHGGETNPYSIGLDLNNFLDTTNTTNNYTHGWTEKHRNQARPIYMRARSRRIRINGSWKQAFGYTDAQYATLIQLIKFLHNHLGLKKMPPLDEKGRVLDRVMNGVEDFEGWIGHYHCKASKWDPGPGFDWKRVISGIHGERNSWPVERYTRLEELYGALVTAEAQRFYDNTELQDSGGYYPVGLKQTWHNGVHLFAPRRTPVKAMVDGTIVAARFTEKGALGDASFVLIRHSLPHPRPKKGKPKKKPMLFYSLYMHLDNENLTQTSAQLDWLKRLWRAGKGDLKGAPKRRGRPGRRPDDDDPLVPIKEARSPVNEVGNGLAAMLAGKVSRLSQDAGTAIKVASGTTIGHVGEFRGQNLLHVEVFAASQEIDLDVHGRHWRTIDEEEGDDPFVDTADIWTMFDDGSFGKRSKREDFDPRRVLDQDTIVNFYSNRDGEEAYLQSRMRRTICRHISEWSCDIDWVKAIGTIQRWDNWKDFDWENAGIFTKEVKKMLPFAWLNDEMLKYLGLDSALVWTYHPIYFVVWLTLHYTRHKTKPTQARSLKEIREMQLELLKKKRELDRLAERGLAPPPGETDDDHDELDELILDVEISGKLEDQFGELLEKDENGEWPSSYVNSKPGRSGSTDNP